VKIAFIEPHLELYGGIRRIMELSNRLVDLGEDVTIYHPTGQPCTWMKGRARTAPLSALYDQTHDVAIFNDPPDFRHVRKARADVKIFYILCLYEREKLKRFNPKVFWPRRGRMMSLQRALQMPFVRVANATWMQRYLEDELNMESRLLIGGVNRDVFHPVEVEREDGVFRILCSGDPRERKGTDAVHEAFDIVKQRHPNVVLDSYHGRGIRQEVMARVYAGANLFVDAQWYGGWNNPVAEAMACGTPVVCTDIGAVGDFAFHDETALLVPVDDPPSLAGAIGRMIEDPGLRERLKTNALKQIAKFDWDDAARRLQDLLRELSDQRIAR